MIHPTETDEPRWPLWAHIALWVLAAWTGALAFGFLFWYVLGKPPLALETFERQERFLLATTSITVVGGTGLVITLVVRIRTRWFHEQDSRAARYDAAERRITELRLNAVDQLGSEKAAVRIGGLNNLERLGDQHPQLQQVILNEVCAYLRMPFTRPQEDEQLSAQTTLPDACSHDTPDYAEPRAFPPDTSAREEAEVRRTAQRILQRHLAKPPKLDNPEIRNNSRYWEHDSLDLTGAYLYGADFRHGELHNVTFAGAFFEGLTQFENVEFIGPASFHDAKFRAWSLFDNATFHADVTFTRANFGRRAGFDGTVFKGDARFGDEWIEDLVFEFEADKQWFASNHATFESFAWFTNAHFESKAQFDGVVFNNIATFHNASFNADTSFNRAIARMRTEDTGHQWPARLVLVPDTENPGWGRLSRGGDTLWRNLEDWQDMVSCRLLQLPSHRVTAANLDDCGAAVFSPDSPTPMRQGGAHGRRLATVRSPSQLAATPRPSARTRRVAMPVIHGQGHLRGPDTRGRPSAAPRRPPP